MTDLSAFSAGLPVAEALPALLETLDRQPNAVLAAPPGAGKTTLVPLALLDHAPDWLEGGKILLVEPRRVAVRGAAARMASMRGETPGGTIGYRTRLDSAVSSRTRVEVVTEGLLVRRLLADPLLDGVSMVIFDEVHERSLDGDTGLGLCLDVQRSFRPELRLLAMSATLDAGLFTDRLHAPLIESAGQAYPVAVKHGPDVLVGSARGARQVKSGASLPEAAAAAIVRAWAEEEGSILVFLPGVGEIRRVQSLLEKTLLGDVPVYPLFGEQKLEDQALALDSASGRRVVLATSIAETSVTVPGVRVVIDGGWRRTPERDPGTGLPRLRTRRIARATAEQRAGRAGRQGPGVAVRLWSEMTQRALPVQETPAIREADLCDFALVAAAWEKTMGTAPENLPLIEPPPEGALAAAQALLETLGALKDNKLTALGARMARFGTHPRLAAMLCAARTPSELVTAACLAAVLEERDPLQSPGIQNSGFQNSGRGGSREAISADLRDRLRLFSHDDPRVPRHVASRLREGARRFLRRAPTFATDTSTNGLSEKASRHLEPALEGVGRLVAAGFPDRLALKAGAEGRFRLAGGGSGQLSGRDPLLTVLTTDTLLACAAFHTARGAEITLAAPVALNALPEAVQAQITEQRDSALDGTSGRVVVRQRLRLGALVLRDRNEQATSQEALPVLLARVQADLTGALPWTEVARQFQARVGRARASDSGGNHEKRLPDLSDAALAADLSWLAPYLAGFDRMSQLASLDVLGVLRARLDYSQLKALDSAFPPKVVLKNSVLSVDYTGAHPSVSARAQAFYGMETLPEAGGRPIQAVLLSPAGRPQATTADLGRFWKEGWADMRRDMRGRYPKHDWPEDPAHATPPAPRAEPGSRGSR